MKTLNFKWVKMADVKFGIRVPSFPINGSRGQAFVLQIIRFLRVLEEQFDSAWISDHFIPWADFESKETDILECFTAISYLSAIFNKLDFGSIVLCNSYRNPPLVAKMAATLDALTGGRFIFGIGAGWMEEDYMEYGYDFPPPATRIKQLEEGVQIIKKMWAEDGVTFEGEYFRVRNAHCNPKPYPPPPIMIGGGGEKLLLRAVARYADWWNIANANLRTYTHKLDVLRRHCSRVGRDPGEILKTLGNMVAIAETDEEALKMARESPFIGEENMDAYLVGAPQTIKEKIRAFTDNGVKYFILRFIDFPRLDGARLFAEDVIPEFNR